MPFGVGIYVEQINVEFKAERMHHYFSKERQFIKISYHQVFTSAWRKLDGS